VRGLLCRDRATRFSVRSGQSHCFVGSLFQRPQCPHLHKAHPAQSRRARSAAVGGAAGVPILAADGTFHPSIPNVAWPLPFTDAMSTSRRQRVMTAANRSSNGCTPPAAGVPRTRCRVGLWLHSSKSVPWRIAGVISAQPLGDLLGRAPDQRLVSLSQGGTSTGTAKPAFTRSNTTSVLKHLMSGIS